MDSISGRPYSLSIEVSSRDGGKPYKPHVLPHEYSLTFGSDDREAWESFTEKFWSSVFGASGDAGSQNRLIVVDRSIPKIQ